MIQFTTNAQAIAQLAKVLEGNASQLKRDVRTAVNKTITNTQSQWAKEIGKEVALTPKAIKQVLKKEIAQSLENPSGSVVLSKSKRLPLKEFKPRQTAKGVSYTAYKGKKRQTLKSAFLASTVGNHVFSRQGAKRVMTKGRYKGKMRQPIVKRFGPTPFDATVTFEIPKKIMTVARERLLKELQDRIRFRQLKASGVI
jgi:hypothetical protein